MSLRIRQVKPALVFDAEFRGFFFGEGCLDLTSPARGTSRVPRARIGMNERDRPALVAIQERFGGSLRNEPRKREWIWSITGRDRVAAVLDVLEAGHLPSAKRQEVALMREALALVPRRGVRITPEASAALMSLTRQLQRAKATT